MTSDTSIEALVCIGCIAIVVLALALVIKDRNEAVPVGWDKEMAYGQE